MKLVKIGNLLCLSNDPIEKYIKKGTFSNYHRYVNPDMTFRKVVIIANGVSQQKRLPPILMEDLEIHRIFGNRLLSLLRKLILAIHITRRKNINVIRAYNPLVEGFIVIIIGLLCKIPSVVSVHSDYQLLLKIRRYPLIMRIGLNVLQRIVYRFSTRVFCVSNGLADYVVSMNADPKKVRVIYNKVQISKFQNIIKDNEKKTLFELGIDSHTFILLYVGRICPEKDLNCILDAIQILKNKGYEICFIIVGDEMPDLFVKSLKDKLLLKIEQLDIKQAVRILGFKQNDELPVYYNLADAFVFPTLVYGFGVVLVEAQSAGLPILASNILYPKDHGDIVDPKNALFFDPANPTDLANKIALVINDEAIRKKLSRLGASLSHKYEWNKIEKWEARCYKELLEGNKEK